MKGIDQKPTQPEEGIEQSIELWKNSIVMFAVLLLGALIGYFWFYVKHLPPDLDATDRLGIGDWGAFGDFMGGLMNPIVAFAALYWLTQSVKLQKTELAETRKALEGSEKAQTIQAANSDKNIRISSRAALVDALQSQIAAREDEIRKCETDIEKIVQQLAEMNPMVHAYLKRKSISMSATASVPGVELLIMYKTQDLENYKARAQSECQKLMQERDMHLNELRKIVEES